MAETLELFQPGPQIIPSVSELSSGFHSGDSFDDKVLASIGAIKALFRKGIHPLIGCSFGKDSSVLLVLALRALEEVIKEQGTAPRMFVVMSNTNVENPVMEHYSRREMQKVAAYAKAKNLPVEAHIAQPSLSNDYLVSLIGGRTIASTPQGGRKCTVSLKIRPVEKLKRQLAKRMGFTARNASDHFCTLLGKRRDESAVRGRSMEAAGERADTPVRYPEDDPRGEWVLSPIAEWTLNDVFQAIGHVRNKRWSTYSDFEALTKIYRSTNEGLCMVNAFMKGQPKTPPCNARTGCWVCLHVSRDASLESLLKDDEYAWMKPLNDFRNFILANHNRPDKRNWLARTVNDDGTINLAPNSYSPSHCRQLLQLALSIDAQEREAAAELGITPRFQLLSIQQIVGIDFLWSRYGYQPAFTACHLARAVEHGERWQIPTADSSNPVRRQGITQRPLTLPFADHEFGHFSHGGLDWSAAVTDSVPATHQANGDEFAVDEEGAELFWSFERDRVLDTYGPANGEGEDGRYGWLPAAAAHYFLRLGTIALAKGTEGELDRMFQVSNQIQRLGLRPVLHDPEQLIQKLRAHGSILPPRGHQLDIDDLLRNAPVATDTSCTL